jgi:hypothetical protein
MRQSEEEAQGSDDGTPPPGIRATCEEVIRRRSGNNHAVAVTRLLDARCQCRSVIHAAEDGSAAIGATNGIDKEAHEHQADTKRCETVD